MTSHDTREHHVKEGELCDVSSKLQIQQSVAVIGKYLKEFEKNNKHNDILDLKK